MSYKNYTFSLSQFEMQMKYLKYLYDNKFTSLTASEVSKIINGNYSLLKSKDKLVAITFDEQIDVFIEYANLIFQKYSLNLLIVNEIQKAAKIQCFKNIV
ncbi:MAG: hypothetical protein ACK4YF_03560 [Exilispira sp.]